MCSYKRYFRNNREVKNKILFFNVVLLFYKISCYVNAWQIYQYILRANVWQTNWARNKFSLFFKLSLSFFLTFLNKLNEAKSIVGDFIRKVMTDLQTFCYFINYDTQNWWCLSSVIICVPGWGPTLSLCIILIKHLLL